MSGGRPPAEPGPTEPSTPHPAMFARAPAEAITLAARHSAARRAGPGDRLAAAVDEPCLVRAAIHGVPHATVTFHTELGAAHRATLPAAGTGTVEWRTRPRESGFVRAEVRDADGAMAALSNPVLLEAA
ncbi:hypothetical protein ACWC9S_21405 [Streptomyces xiamenensis]